MVARSGNGLRAASTRPASMKLRKHDVTLTRITPQRLTQDDWDILLAWSSDPEILHDTEADDVRGYDLAQVQEICRGDGARRSQVRKCLGPRGRMRRFGAHRRRASTATTFGWPRRLL
jgi:hypothetical protein